MNPLTHLNDDGAANMVDTGDKPVTRRTARATSFIGMRPETLAAVKSQAIQKGDVLAIARVAGIQAAKQTQLLIPLCHQLALDSVSVDFEIRDDGIRIESTAVATARTGVEMEALTAASVASLTLYDMCKSMEKGMAIGPLCLIEKTGGRHGDYVRKDHDR